MHGFQSGITPRISHSCAKWYVGYKKPARSPPPAGINAFGVKRSCQKNPTVRMPNAPNANKSYCALRRVPKIVEGRGVRVTYNRISSQTTAAAMRIILARQAEQTRLAVRRGPRELQVGNVGIDIENQIAFYVSAGVHFTGFEIFPCGDPADVDCKMVTLR